MIDLGLVHPATLPYVWADVVEILEEKGGEWLEIVKLDDILQKLIAGELELWIGNDDSELEMVMVCGWEKHAKRSFYHIMWIGGHNLFKYLDGGLQTVEQCACVRGATEVVFSEGRAGWFRVLKTHGYRTTLGMKKNVQVCWRH